MRSPIHLLKLKNILTVRFDKMAVLIGVILCMVSCQKKEEVHEELEPTLFENIETSISKIDFKNKLIPNDSINILDYLYYYNGGGVAIGDINNDGLPDVYLTANQAKNKLYLNKGDFIFEDITDKAGVAGTSDWNTGVTMADVNGDGLLDIYVCAVSGIQGLQGKNELYINQGDQTFKEMAKEYHLNFETFATTASFFDYDNDGDLDMYLLNHAVHTQNSFGNASLREKPHRKSGDRLLRNDGGKFTDVTLEAGIYNGGNGYGLGIITQDFNNDGFTDIYVSNDFHEDDYYYVNNGNGIFIEKLKEKFGHTSRFSMGNDASDINNDGYSDIITLDMASENEEIYKASAGDETIDMLRMRIDRLGYFYQFSRNMLQVNQAANHFSETALASGIAYADWSWSALFSDFDQDGKQDLFISNGIPKRPNDLDFIKYISNNEIKKQLSINSKIDAAVFDKMPSGLAQNQFFNGENDSDFINVTEKWLPGMLTASTGSAYADLDNDGDLDLVINNINNEATLLKNNVSASNAYLKLHLRFKNKNIFGIGTKVITYQDENLQSKQLYQSKGFQSSSEPIIHFGYGKETKVDSIQIIWPDRTYQTLTDVAVNQTLIITYHNTKPYEYKKESDKTDQLFTEVPNNLGIDFVHKEDAYIDFNRQGLIPYQIGDRGPAVALGDINNDGVEDIFFGGSKRISSKIYLQNKIGYSKKDIPSLQQDSINEDVAAVIEDFDQDGKNEVFVGTGGGDFFNTMKPLLDYYYRPNDSIFEKVALPEYFENAAVIKTSDFDNDGDLDVFVGNQSVSNDFGKIPASYLLENIGNGFTIKENKELEQVGMVTDAIWNDFDQDGIQDLVIVGEWMAPTFFRNNKGTLAKVDVGIDNVSGLWQSVAPMDIDGDGDTDYVLGNWGLNSKFKASSEFPMKMYYGDVDKNGQTETIVVTEKNGKYYPIESFDELAAQIQFLKKKFTSYNSFAGKSFPEIFEKDQIKNLKVFEVNELRSGYLKNNDGRFTFVPFSNRMQLAPIMTLLAHDFDKDGKKEVLAAGNYFGLKPFQGRLDAFDGALIKDEHTIKPGNTLGLDLALKSARHLNIIKRENKEYLLITFNNDRAQVYEIYNSNKN